VPADIRSLQSLNRDASTRPTRRYLTLILFTVVAASVALGCTATEDKSEHPSTTTTTASAAIGQDTNVAALDLSLELPDSFQVADNPDYAFLARRLTPRAILTIHSETSSVVNHEPQSGETVSQGVLEDRSAVIVLRAKVDGLPAGIVANKLLVDNGSDSFTLTLSSDPASVDQLWQRLIHSIRFRS
jgi:hypothetical protein